MLTHVSMWKNGKWMRITAKEAAALFPYTVSVNQKLFVCELCGQYVTFTGPGLVTRHFKHSRGDTDKDCEERSLNYEITPFNDNERTLIIKIEVNEKQCHFLLGFPALPDSVSGEFQNEHVIIEYDRQKKEYNVERFGTERSVFFAVGTELANEYRIGYSSDALKKECGFPAVTEGYAGKGRLFDCESGRMLPFDADVTVRTRYYYLTKAQLSQRKDPYVKKMMDLKNGFKIYEMMPTALDESNAIYFLELRARLTNTPLRVLTLWPPIKQLNDTVIHRQKDVLTLVFGDVRLSLNDSLKRPIALDRDKWSLYHLQFGEKRNNLLVGRSRVLTNNQYLLSEKVFQRNNPIVELFDINNTLIEETENEKKPLQDRVILKSEYDGYAIVYDKRGITYIDFSAEQETEFEKIEYGTRIQIFIGNQLEREYYIKTRNKETRNQSSENDIYRKLLKSRGVPVPVSHAVRGALSSKYKSLRIRCWLRQQGERIPEDALEILKAGFEGKG